LSGTVDNLIPDFSWRTVTDTYHYQLDLSRSQAFAVLEENTANWLIDPHDYISFTYHVHHNLIPDTTYYWRMASVCENNVKGEYSPSYTFFSGPAGGTLPISPTLTSPLDGAHTGSIRVNFLWESIADAAGYQVHFYDSLAEAENDHERTTTWWSYNRPSLSRNFDPEAVVYWRVSAKNGYAWGPLSSIRSFTTPPVTATLTLQPALGGTLTPDPGNISIQFPPGAITTTTNISYTLQPVPSQNLANFRFAGRAFTLNASAANGDPVTTFQSPFTLTIEYDSYDLLASGIANPADLNLVFWNGAEWEEILPCAGCSVDVEARRITLILDHFTEFALVAPKEDSLKIIYLPAVVR
jgi:hypothetical protein